jgi:hypothetical protein
MLLKVLKSPFLKSFSTQTLNCDPLAKVLKGNRKGFIPRRATLYVPGDKEKMLQKVPSIEKT